MKRIISILVLLFILIFTSGCVNSSLAKDKPTITQLILSPPDDGYIIQKNYQYEEMKSHCVIIHTGLFMGTGVIIHEDDKYSYIITDNHVITKAFYILIGIPSDDKGLGTIGNIYDAELLDSNKSKDLALLRTKKFVGFHPAHMEYKNFPSILSNVYCLGFPLDETLMTTKGVVSRYFMFMNRMSIQVDAATYCGGSGGPVFDEDGKVIGVVDAIFNGNNKETIPNFNIVTSSYEIKKWLEQSKFSFVLKETK